MSTGPAGLSVLHVLEALEGGTARHLVDLVGHTEGVRHHVAIPSERVGGVTDRAAAGAIHDAGGTVHTIEMRRAPASGRNATAGVALRRLIRQLRPNVVHGHSSIGGALARLATSGPTTARVYTPHGVLTQQPYLSFERLLGRRTDRLIAVSDSEGELVRRLNLVPGGRVTVVPNGIALDAPAGEAVDLRAQLGVPAGAELVGCVARLFPQKAPLDFVRVSAALARARPGTHAVLIGSGPLQADVTREVKATGVTATFHQLAGVPNAALVLGQLDVLVNPSRFEGLPYGPLEAMRAGTAVVLSDAVGNRDVAEDGVSGLVLAVGDVEGMARAVVRLLDDAAFRGRLVTAARVRLAERFDVRDMGPATVDVYRRAMFDRAGRRRARPAFPGR